MLDRKYPLCLGSLLKGEGDSAVSDFFDHKQHFD